MAKAKAAWLLPGASWTLIENRGPMNEIAGTLAQPAVHQ
jgi:hypothetical protein